MIPGGAITKSNNTDDVDVDASSSGPPVTFMKKSMSSPALNWILNTPPLSGYGAASRNAAPILSPYTELEDDFDDEDTDSD